MARTKRLLVILGLVVGGTAVLGQDRRPESQPASQDGTVDPMAATVLRDVCDRLEAAKSFAFRAQVTWETAGEHKLQFGAVQTVALRRPDRLRVEYRGDLSERLAWFDGKRWVYLDPVQNLYAELEAGPTLDEAMDTLFDKAGFNFPLSDFFYSDAHESLVDSTLAGEYVGLHTVDGVQCHHLAFSRETVDWQVWIDAGRAGLPRKFVMTYKLLEGAPEFSATFDNWEVGKRIPDRRFVAKLGEDASRIDFIASIQRGDQ